MRWRKRQRWKEACDNCVANSSIIALFVCDLSLVDSADVVKLINIDDFFSEDVCDFVCDLSCCDAVAIFDGNLEDLSIFDCGYGDVLC